MYKCVIENEIIINMVTSIVGVVATIVLTILIIRITANNHKRTEELEREISEKEDKMHERQLRVEIYSHKREIYRNAMSIFELCNAIKLYQEKMRLNEKSDDTILGVFETTFDNYVPNRRDAIQNLYESRFIFPQELSDKLMIIRTEFDTMCAVLSQYRILNTHLSDEEKRTEMPKIRDEFFKQFKESTFTIYKQKKAIDEAMKKDMAVVLPA